MSPLLNAREIEAGLIAVGVPPEKARAEALRQIGGGDSSVLASITGPAMPQIAWPVRLLIPWSHLVSDNRKYGVIDGKLILTKEYRRAKHLIGQIARGTVGDAEPAHVPLELTADVWVPDDVRAHDVCNFAKAVHDAMEGVVYTKDRWLYRVTWERAGVDVDAPRAVVTIRPLLNAEPPRAA